MKKFIIVLFLLVLNLHAHPENIFSCYSKELQEINSRSHYSQPWKVHEIAQDFMLLDVWEYPILADISKGQDFLFFLKMIQKPPPEKVNGHVSIRYLAAGLLISLRKCLGKILGLDKNINTLPIPGCRETSTKERLSAEDRTRSLALPEWGVSDSDQGTWRAVYLYEDEMLSELSIGIVHVLMHLGWVHKSGNLFTARLAVYAKPRGMIGHLYMKLITPFRRAVIYPALMEKTKYAWEFYSQKE